MAKKSIFDLTKNIIKEINSSKKNIKFIYISSDHVFDGNSKLLIHGTGEQTRDFVYVQDLVNKINKSNYFCCTAIK